MHKLSINMTNKTQKRVKHLELCYADKDWLQIKKKWSDNRLILLKRKYNIGDMN